MSQLATFEVFNRPRKCPKCKKMHLDDGYTCEHCLHILVDSDPEISQRLR